MRPARATAQDRSAARTALLFRWRGQPKAAFPKLLPLVLATLAFAVLLGFVRVKVAAPQFNIASKASLIQLPAAGEGVAWALRAKEGGPWLAKYNPADWSAYPALDAEVLQATRIPAQPYVPVLRQLPPPEPAKPQLLAAIGEPVLPRRIAAAAVHHDAAACHLAPVLYPLSALGAVGLPQALPPFTAEIDAAMAAADWRFLLRLHPAGGVADCVSLTKAAGVGLLERWLRGVTFDPKLAAGGGWLAIGIEFNNQPINGTDTR
jgi:hypothetical protein